MGNPVPYFQDDAVTLYCGDMREVLPALQIEPACVVTDPPYGETSLAWDRWPAGWPGLVADVADSMWCFGSTRMFLDQRDDFAAWNLSQDLVWEKQNGTGLAADRFKRVHELALHWYRGGWNLIHHETPRVTSDGRDKGTVHRQGQPPHLGTVGSHHWVDDGTRLMRSVIRAPNMWRRGAIHPTEKPLEVLLPLIEYACPPGGLVVDPFAGSGSTGDAARVVGRRAVLIEANERYCAAIVARLSQGVLDLAGGATRA